MRSIVASLLVGIAALAGCASPEESNETGTNSNAPSGASAGGLVVTITNVTKTPGSCGQDYGDPICHILSLHIQNGRSKEFSTNPFFWDATTSTGGQISYASDIDGPDAVSPGATIDIKALFQVTDDANLVKLEYDSYDTKLSLDVPAYPAARPPWPDNADKVTKLDILATASNEDSDAAKEGKVTVQGEGSDSSKNYRFAASLHIKLEKRTSSYPETTYSTVGEWDQAVTPADFGTGYSIEYNYVIQDSNFDSSGTYRVTVTAAMTKTGQSFSDVDTIFY